MGPFATPRHMVQPINDPNVPTYQVGSPGVLGALGDFFHAITQAAPSPPATPDTLGTGLAANAGKTISGRQKQIDDTVENASR